MMVLDTHVFIWWISSPDKLSFSALSAIEQTRKDKKLLVSSISVWELCMLVSKKRLQLTMDLESWIKQAEQIHSLKFVPVDNEIARLSVHLPEPFHQDPADRIIVATALRYGVPLITADERIHSYQPVQTIW